MAHGVFEQNTKYILKTKSYNSASVPAISVTSTALSTTSAAYSVCSQYLLRLSELVGRDRRNAARLAPCAYIARSALLSAMKLTDSFDS